MKDTIEEIVRTVCISNQDMQRFQTLAQFNKTIEFITVLREIIQRRVVPSFSVNNAKAAKGRIIFTILAATATHINHVFFVSDSQAGEATKAGKIHISTADQAASHVATVYLDSGIVHLYTEIKKAILENAIKLEIQELQNYTSSKQYEVLLCAISLLIVVEIVDQKNLLTGAVTDFAKLCTHIIPYGFEILTTPTQISAPGEPKTNLPMNLYIILLPELAN